MDKERKDLTAKVAVELGTDILNKIPAGNENRDIRGKARLLQRTARLLESAWSPMAVRNILADLERQVGALRLTPHVTDSPLRKSGCDVLRDVIKRELRQHSPSQRRYTSALCLGYRVKTAGDRYTGKNDDWQDMKARCRNMIKTIKAAYRLADTHGGYNIDDTVLKVFMAPEFFFRGRNGAYEHSLVHGVEKPKSRGGRLKNFFTGKSHEGLLDILNEELDKSIYGHWLFVLGSAICATKITEFRCTSCPGEIDFRRAPNARKSKPTCKSVPAHKVKEMTVGAMVENVAFIKKGKEVHTVSKELVSGIDYVKDDTKGERNVVTVMKKELDVIRHAQGSGYNAASGVPTKFQDERMGGGVFTIDGITFGLEVCLDHAATVASDDSGRLDNASNIQIHLIPSAGMFIGKLRSVRGGISFNVDGSTPHVQVVGGDPTDPEVRFDMPGKQIEDLTASWDTAAPHLNQLLNHYRDSAANPMPGGWYESAPTQTVAVGGSVLCYGPYPIPPV